MERESVREMRDGEGEEREEERWNGRGGRWRERERKRAGRREGHTLGTGSKDTQCTSINDGQGYLDRPRKGENKWQKRSVICAELKNRIITALHSPTAH